MIEKRKDNMEKQYKIDIELLERQLMNKAEFGLVPVPVIIALLKIKEVK